MSAHTIFAPGDTVGLIACSDGIPLENRTQVEQLIAVLERLGLQAVLAPTLFRRENAFSGSPEDRGKAFNGFFADPSIKAVFDISGGDSANQMLPLIDFDMVQQNPKPFFGMSDLSVVLNALYQKTGLSSYHYQPLNLVLSQGETHQSMFVQTFFQGGDLLFRYPIDWIRGSGMDGIVIGGNIRCLLKLAGTSYLPDFHGRILFLESLGGRANRIVSLLAQLDQIGALQSCAGILLGTFTELEQGNELPIVLEYLEGITRACAIPIGKTQDLGHGGGGKCIRIGEFLSVQV